MTSSRGFPAAWGLPGLVPKPCDCCHSATALLFCHTDSTFLCVPCDAKMHAATKHGARHERVWMCEVCEQAPAVVTCKADAAVLCFSCDSDIHSANPLSRRHERVPVVPFYDTAESVVKSTAASLLASPVAAPECDVGAVVNAADYFVSDVSAGWITSDQKAQADVKSTELVFSEPDCFMDCFMVPHHYSAGTDGVVPVQAAFKQQFLSSEKHFEIDFTKSNVNSYNHSYAAPSLSQSVSSSSMDVGVVPDGSSLSEISYSIGGNLSGGGASSAASGQAPGLDREARVLRYREKRKNRKFEKTIRYASRKAYAEKRPRIKGRFAKRTETVEPDDVFCPSTTANFFPESRYGVVPSFC